MSSSPLEIYGYGRSSSSSSNRAGLVNNFKHLNWSSWGRHAPPRLPKVNMFSTIPGRDAIGSGAGGGPGGATQISTDEDANKTKRAPIADERGDNIDAPSTTTGARQKATGNANNGNVEEPPGTTSDARSGPVQVEKAAASSRVEFKVPQKGREGTTRDANKISSVADNHLAAEQGGRSVGAEVTPVSERSSEAEEDASDDKHPTGFGSRGWYSPEQVVPKK